MNSREMIALWGFEVSRGAIGDRGSGLPLTRDDARSYPRKGQGKPLPLCPAARVKKGCRGLAPCSGRRGRQPRELSSECLLSVVILSFYLQLNKVANKKIRCYNECEEKLLLQNHRIFLMNLWATMKVTGCFYRRTRYE